jgi:transposase-like protein
MRKGDVICPECGAGFHRIELGSRRGTTGEFRCPLCNRLLEVFDGSTEVAYRLTVAPEKIFE